MARSLRRIEDQGDFQGRLNLARLARSTTSDALTACDPKVLLPVIQDLRERTPNLKRADASVCAAHVIGSICRLRWQIELFFKWFKTFAVQDVRAAQSPAEHEPQRHYVPTVRRSYWGGRASPPPVLMMVVQTGRRNSIYALAVLSHVAAGTMSLSQALAVIEKRNREREMERARQAHRRAAKKPV